MNDIIISIIVPVYNAENSISKCLDSLVRQTLKDIEIIVVDDGSVDQSGSICDRYSTSYKNIKVIHQSNSGVSSTRNKGISISKGKYIGFVDSDDTVDSTMFEKLLKTTRLSNAELCMCGYEEKGTSNVFYSSSPSKIDRYETLKLIIADGCYRGYVWNKLFRRDIIIKNGVKFKEELHMCEDLSFCIDYIQHINSACAISEKLYFYGNYAHGIVNVGFNDKRWSVVEAYEYIMSLDFIKNNDEIYRLVSHRYIMHLLSMYNMLRKNTDKRYKREYQSGIKYRINKVDNDFLMDKKYKAKYKVLFIYMRYFKKAVIK